MAPSLPDGLRHSVALADYTTWKVGGPATVFAEPESTEELLDLLRWAQSEGCSQRSSAPAPTCSLAIKVSRASLLHPAPPRSGIGKRQRSD